MEKSAPVTDTNMWILESSLYKMLNEYQNQNSTSFLGWREICAIILSVTRPDYISLSEDENNSNSEFEGESDEETIFSHPQATKYVKFLFKLSHLCCILVEFNEFVKLDVNGIDQVLIQNFISSFVSGIEMLNDDFDSQREFEDSWTSIKELTPKLASVLIKCDLGNALKSFDEINEELFRHLNQIIGKLPKPFMFLIQDFLKKSQRFTVSGIISMLNPALDEAAILKIHQTFGGSTNHHSPPHSSTPVKSKQRQFGLISVKSPSSKSQVNKNLFSNGQARKSPYNTRSNVSLSNDNIQHESPTNQESSVNHDDTGKCSSFSSQSDLSFQSLSSPIKRNKKHSKRMNDTKSGRKFFTDEEQLNLINGVKTYGSGKWSHILSCYKFNGRTSVDLKDKWRNLKKKYPNIETQDF